MKHWVVWVVDDRPLEWKRRGTRMRPGRHYNGVWRVIDPKKRMAFSCVSWTCEPFATNSPWTYEKAHAERFYTRRAAFAMRRLLWELGWGRGDHKTLRDAYGITRITKRDDLRGDGKSPEGNE